MTAREATVGRVRDVQDRVAPEERAGSEVALLTGGGDRPYALGLAMALMARGIRLDFIGSDDLESPELLVGGRLRFLNLRGSQGSDASFVSKLWRVVTYYVRLIRYAWVAEPRIFHILWNNKWQAFDRTLLMLYYRLVGKRVVLTAHNVNAGKRDASDSVLNRLTLKAQYRLADHVFVHTEALRRELVEEFGVADRAVSVIPFGINNVVPETGLTRDEARGRLGIREDERTILFFGNIGPYKGVDVLVATFQELARRCPGWRLIVAGRARPGCQRYLDGVRRAIREDASRAQVIERFEYVPDEDAEVYFKAADLLVLPYREVSQSGVLVLGYRFGLPVVAADVGSLGEDIVEGVTGLLCRPGDPGDLARAIEAYFGSELFKDLDNRRASIRRYAEKRYSWDSVSTGTARVYGELLACRR